MQKEKQQPLIQLNTENGEPFDIPEDGSLGLLALGYIGVMLWREKRRQIQLDKQPRYIIANEKT